MNIYKQRAIKRIFGDSIKKTDAPTAPKRNPREETSPDAKKFAAACDALAKKAVEWVSEAFMDPFECETQAKAIKNVDWGCKYLIGKVKPEALKICKTFASACEAFDKDNS